MVDAIDASEAQRILESPDLIAIGVRADDVRRAMHGTRTTFVRVYEIHVDAVPASLPARVSAGEFRIVGRPMSADAAVTAVRAAVTLAGSVPVTGFSLADLRAVAGAAFPAACRALREAGLDGLAEVEVDLVDSDSAALIAQARACGLGVTRLTVHAPVQDRVALAVRARDLQEAVGGFRVFAPLPRSFSPAAPSTGYDDVKSVAITRLLITGIESIQVDWALYGPKLAQFALTVGADDVDGVAASDPGTLGARRSPIEEIRGNIRSAGLEPAERNARYEAVE
ncbi:MAG: aminodeoxyfutalosine synthase [Acidobacteriota bacterium]|jgi:aminodeoxyfutalosine synthase